MALPVNCSVPRLTYKLLDVETQIQWLKEIGFEDVDCLEKWRELALLVGTKTDEQGRGAHGQVRSSFSRARCSGQLGSIGLPAR